MIVGRIISISLKALKPTYFHSCLQQKMGYLLMFSRWSNMFLACFFSRKSMSASPCSKRKFTNLLFKVKALRLPHMYRRVFNRLEPQTKTNSTRIPNSPIPSSNMFVLTKNRSKSLLNQKLVFAQHTVYIRRGLLAQFCCWNLSKLPVFK